MTEQRTITIPTTIAAGATLQPFKTLFIWEVCR